MSTATTVSQPEPLKPAPEAPPEPARNLAFYRAAVTKHLDPSVFKPNPARLVWYFGCVFGALAAFYAMVFVASSWPMKLLCGVIIGVCNGTLGFVAHELAHGSIVKSRRAQLLMGFFGTLPFLISPTFWKFTHNRLHHGSAQRLIEDPDAFPNLRIYRNSKYIRFMFPFTPGSGYKRSALYFTFWLSVHYFVAQVYLRFRNRIYDGMDHNRVTWEFGGQIAVVVALAAIAGPSNWLWLLIIPMAIQNYMLMSYIATNHNLSPLTSENDPLANSLTVTNHPVLEFFHLNFGYHVEHHLYPTVNGKHVKAVHHELLRQFPETYKVMPKWQAIRLLYKTARIYKNSRELVHPETLETYPTI